MSVKQGQTPRKYTIDQDKLQDFLNSIDTDKLTDPQKCGHILTFFKQQGIIKHTTMDPQDIYVRDQNAAGTARGGSIDMSGARKKNGSQSKG